MNNSLLFICAMVVIYSCHKNYNGNGNVGPAALPIHLCYLDSNGNQLYSITNDGQNGFWMDSFQVRNIDVGSKYISLDCFDNNTVGYSFQPLIVLETLICPNLNINNGYSYTILNLSSKIQDTLKVHITSKTFDVSANTDSIWYNGKLVTYDETGNHRGTVPIVR